MTKEWCHSIIWHQLKLFKMYFTVLFFISSGTCKIWIIKKLQVLNINNFFKGKEQLFFSSNPNETNTKNTFILQKPCIFQLLINIVACKTFHVLELTFGVQHVLSLIHAHQTVYESPRISGISIKVLVTSWWYHWHIDWKRSRKGVSLT